MARLGFSRLCLARLGLARLGLVWPGLSLGGERMGAESQVRRATVAELGNHHQGFPRFCTSDKDPCAELSNQPNKNT